MKIAFVLILFLAFIAHYAVGDCCGRKPDFGCAGNGTCNIACCNCDGGCEPAIENGCSAFEYVLCAVQIAKVIAECIVPEDFYECAKEILGAESMCLKCLFDNDHGSSISEIDAFAIYARENLKKGVAKISLNFFTHATKEQLAEAMKYDQNGDGYFNLAEFIFYNKATAAKKGQSKQDL